MTETATMELEWEDATYRKHLPELLQEDRGRFVVIKGDVIAGVYDTYRDADQIGHEKFGLAQFMIRKIVSPDDRPAFFGAFSLWR
jgi:hypothetical protein